MRFVLILIFAFNFIFGASFIYPDFKQCYRKNIKSIVYFKGTKAVAITKHYAVSYTKKRPRYPFVKHDPYLNLYLFHSSKILQPVKFKNTDKLTLGEWLASMDDKSMYIGNFAQRGIGLDIYFRQNSKTPPNSMISCLCCDIYGIGVGNGKFISSNLIKKFLNSKEIFYGDIGVKLARRGKDVVVAYVNPIYRQRKLKVGDIIKKIDGKKIETLRDAKNLILFQKRNHILKIEFLRKNALHVVKIKVQQKYIKRAKRVKRYRLLEKKGIFFDKNLKIIRIAKKSFGERSGLKTGDKLLQVNQKSVKSIYQANREFTKNRKKEVNLLFDRHDFQFFVKVNL